MRDFFLGGSAFLLIWLLSKASIRFCEILHKIFFLFLFVPVRFFSFLSVSVHFCLIEDFLVSPIGATI